MTKGFHTQAGPPDSLQPGTPLLRGQFRVESFLNAGGFGITYLARNSLERRVVIKECYPSTMCCRSRRLVSARSQAHQEEFDVVVRLFVEEARRLAKLDHPNIVGVHDVFEDNGTAYMALDYVEGCDLLDVIQSEPQRLRPADIQRITMKLLEAIDHVHSQNMLHRDISPDNVLLNGANEPILIDFGAARDTARRASRMLSALQVVKDGYSPQEFYLSGSAQNPAGDLYSLAATLYHLLTGEAPLYSYHRLAAVAERKPDPYVPLIGRVAGFDPYFLGAIDQALSVFARDRPQSAAAWMMAIDLEARQRVQSERIADDPEVFARIRRLVVETNAAVRIEQERAARESAERARRKAAEAQAREAARRRIREEAIREAEEAERARLQAIREAEEAAEVARQEARRQAEQASLAETPAEAEEAVRCRSGTRRTANPRKEASTAEVTHEASKAVEPNAKSAGVAPAGDDSRPSWLRRVWGGQRRRETVNGASQMEGYRA